MPKDTRRRGKATGILTEGTPCDPCDHAARCGKERLACQELVAYYATPGSVAWKGPRTIPAVRLPTREVYDRLHAHHLTRAEQHGQTRGKPEKT